MKKVLGIVALGLLLAGQSGIPGVAHATMGGLWITPKVALCAALLQQLKPGHSSPGLSESNTQAAIELLRRFRVEVLRQPVVEQPTIHALNVSSVSGNPSAVRQAVAEEIRGIESQAHMGGQGEQASQGDKILWASVIRGPVEISKFYVELDQAVGNVNHLGIGTAGVLALFSYSTVTRTALYLHALESAGTIQQDPALLLLMVPLIVLKSGLDRYFWGVKDTLFGLSRKLENSAEAALSEDPSVWNFFSTSTWIEREELTRVQQVPKQLISPHVGSTVYRQHLALSESVLLWFYRKLLERAKGRPGAYDKIWIHMDLLAGFDPQNAEPVVIPVLRYSHRPPQFLNPQTRSLRDKIADFTKKPLPLPIGAR